MIYLYIYIFKININDAICAIIHHIFHIISRPCVYIDFCEHSQTQSYELYFHN